MLFMYDPLGNLYMARPDMLFIMPETKRCSYKLVRRSVRLFTLRDQVALHVHCVFTLTPIEICMPWWCSLRTRNILTHASRKKKKNNQTIAQNTPS